MQYGYKVEECNQTDCPYRTEPITNADRIRAMSDEELVNLFYHGIEVQYCKNDPACADLLDTAEGIPEENCKMCLLKWLQQPADTHDNPDLLDEK